MLTAYRETNFPASCWSTDWTGQTDK